VLAGLLVALLFLSGDAAQMSLGLPSSVTGLFQGAMLLILIGTDVLIFYRVRLSRPGIAAEGA
jgi:simple sugar transport system permease protein